MQLVERPLVSEPIEEKGWIYPTESTKPIAGAPDEFGLTPYHMIQASTIKGDSCSRIHMSAYGYLNCQKNKRTDWVRKTK